MGEDNGYYGGDIATARAQQEAITGYDDPSGTAWSLIQPDGSGWYIIPNAGHGYFYTGWPPVATNAFLSGDAPWCMNPNLDWLAGFAGEPVTTHVWLPLVQRE